MTVKQLFQKIVKESEDDFIAFYLDYDHNNTSAKTIKVLLESFCKCKTNKNTENFIIFSVFDIDSHGADSFLIKEEDLNKEVYEKYAYEFKSIPEVLGYQVSKGCVRALGEFNYASSILFEMTFFGYDMKQSSKRVKKEKKKIDKAIAEIKYDTEGKIHVKPFDLDEFKEKFNFKDERTPFEKEFDLTKIEIEAGYQTDVLKAIINLEKKYRNS